MKRQITLIITLQAQLERLQNEIAYTAKRTGIASAAKLATIAPKKELVSSQCRVVTDLLKGVFLAFPQL